MDCTWKRDSSLLLPPPAGAVCFTGTFQKELNLAETQKELNLTVSVTDFCVWIKSSCTASWEVIPPPTVYSVQSHINQGIFCINERMAQPFLHFLTLTRNVALYSSKCSSEYGRVLLIYCQRSFGSILCCWYIVVVRFVTARWRKYPNFSSMG